MEKSEEMMAELEAKVKGTQDYFKKSEELGLAYLDNVVAPALRDVLNDLFVQIEDRHKFESSEKDRIFVIHYTSIAALVSMLQDVSEKEQERKKQEKEAKANKPKVNKPKLTPDDKKSLWRLYDSVHLNDPEEGNFLIRNLPKKYDWLKKREVSHAYIASFIFSNEKDINDNLVFWHAYGREGGGCSLSLSIPHSCLQKVLYGTASKQNPL